MAESVVCPNCGAETAAAFMACQHCGKPWERIVPKSSKRRSAKARIGGFFVALFLGLALQGVIVNIIGGTFSPAYKGLESAIVAIPGFILAGYLIYQWTIRSDSN